MESYVEGNMCCLISVIVPVYNVEDLLARCIESVLGQTFKDFELILVNDGSTDKSGDLCKYYHNCNPNIIKIIDKTNGGLSSARNAGLDIAEGKYVCFIDSDDYVADTYLEILYSNLVQHNVDICCCGYIRTNCDDTSAIIDNNVIVLSNDEAGKYYLSNEITSAWAKLYKKSLFEQIRFPEGLIYEDILLNYNLFQKVNNVVIVKSKLYMYYERSGSITMKPFRMRNLDLLYAWNEVLKQSAFGDKDIKEMAQYRRDRVYFTLLGIIARYGVDSSIDITTIRNIKSELEENFNKSFWRLLYSEKTPLIRKFAMICFRINFKLCCCVGAILRE